MFNSNTHTNTNNALVSRQSFDFSVMYAYKKAFIATIKSISIFQIPWPLSNRLTETLANIYTGWLTKH